MNSSTPYSFYVNFNMEMTKLWDNEQSTSLEAKFNLAIYAQLRLHDLPTPG